MEETPLGPVEELEFDVPPLPPPEPTRYASVPADEATVYAPPPFSQLAVPPPGAVLPPTAMPGTGPWLPPAVPNERLDVPQFRPSLARSLLIIACFATLGGLAAAAIMLWW